MRFALCLLALGCCLLAAADDFDRFARNDRLLGKESFQKGNTAMEENVLIVARALRNAKDSQIKGILKRFDTLARGNDEAMMTGFSWVDGSKVTSGNRTVICVTYGPTGFVQVLRGSSEVAVPQSLKFTEQRSPSVLYFKGNSLVIASRFVRDAGFRDNTKLDFLQVEPTGSAAKLTKSVELEHTLDWGGASVKGDSILAESIDSPESFMVANVSPMMKRVRTYSPRGAMTSNVPGDQEIRAVDSWLLAAQKATNGNADQKLAKSILPEPELLTDLKVSKASVVLEGENGKLRFSLKKGAKGFVVAAVRKV